MNNSKKYFSSLLILSLIITNSINSMGDKTVSISGTARKAKKQARKAKKRVRGMANDVLDFAASLSPDNLFMQQALSGNLSDEQIVGYYPQENSNLGLEGIGDLPEDVKKIILTYMILFNNATSLSNAIQNIKALSLVSKELHYMIYQDPNVFVPMMRNLSAKFKSHPYMIAEHLNHTKGLELFGSEVLPFG